MTYGIKSYLPYYNPGLANAALKGNKGSARPKFKPRTQARTAKKKTNNYTKTTTKLTQGVKACVGGHGGTYSNFYYKSGRVPRAFLNNWKSLGKNYYAINGAFRYTTTPGVQAFNDIVSMFNYTDVNAISQKISAGKQTNKMLLKSCSAEILITNQDSGNVNVCIYDIIARRDLASSANIATPVSAIKNSLLDEGGINQNWDVPGVTPFASDLFTQFFVVKKMTHMTLGQGQAHTHRLNYKPNRQIDGEYIQYNPNGFKNLTCFTVIQQVGLPCNDSVTKTQVSLGGTALDIVFKKQYQYTWMNDLDTTFATVNSLPIAFAVNEEIMNEATGTATIEVQA